MWSASMRGIVPTIVVIALLVGLSASAGPAEAQGRSLSGVRVLAIAPFADNNPETRRVAELGSLRLGEYLKGGRLQVIEPARVAEEMARLGFTAADLISPARAVTLGQRLGAEAILTGRAVQITRDRGMAPGAPEARVTIDVRVLEVSSRLKLFEQEATCSDFSGSLAGAADCLARDLSLRLLGP